MEETHQAEAGSVGHFRDAMVDRLLTGCSIIAALGVPISLSRVPTTGWMPLYGFHALLGTVAITTYLARQRLSTHVKLGIVVVLFYGVGIVGMVNLGLLGAGVWWLVVSSLLLGVLYSPRVGLWATTTSFAFVGLVGYGFVSGHLQLAMDANQYLVSVSSWATLIIATSIMPYFVFQAIATLQAETEELVQQVQVQRDEIHRLATHDQLTGLMMPQALAERLDHAIARSHRTGKRIALMFLDLDRFKRVNDTYGHAAGDHVLQVLAERFTAQLRESDTKARIGGDEFMFLLEEPGSRNELAAIAERLVRDAATPVEFGDLSLQVGASIGISLYPDHGYDTVELRRAADQAMYDVKAAGRNGFRFARDMAPEQRSQESRPVRLVPKHAD